MTTDFVLDSSVTFTWFFENEATPETDGLLDSLNGTATAFVPEHWVLEVSNTLLMAERKKSKDPVDSTQFLSKLDKLSIETDLETRRRIGKDSMTLAREQKLTLYDAAYLELANRRRVSLATLDKDLRAAANRIGVSVLPTI